MSGGKCKVGWSTVTTPEQYGGLGIHDLPRFSRALRLGWLWQSWKTPERPWVGTGTPCDASDRALFAASTAVTIGDGATASFWFYSWLGGRQLCQAFPTLFARSTRKNRSVNDALHADRSILDLRRGDPDAIALQVVQLAREIRQAALAIIPGTEDSITWKLSASGCYTTSSTYNAQFSNRQITSFKSIIWKVWASGKIKMFLWLLHLDRLWCNDRLQRRGWENGYFCPMCMRSLETSVHLCWECPVALQVWHMGATWNGYASLDQAFWHSGTTTTTTTDRVQRIIAAAAPGHRKGVKTVVALISWHIWLEHNACTFRGKQENARHVIEACKRDMEQWRMAGAKCIELPFGEVT
nr:uncharacterized protein LOC109747043 [Aegilops tauschii subsp. strangulata]